MAAADAVGDCGVLSSAVCSDRSGVLDHAVSCSAPCKPLITLSIGKGVAVQAVGAVLRESLCALFFCQLGLWRETEEGHLRLCVLLRL